MNYSLTFEQQGGPEVFKVHEFNIAPPANNEVQVKHTAIGVNYLDIYFRRGDFGPASMPGTTGFEAAGVVTAIGDKINSVKVGDRVAYHLVNGAYCDVRNMSADRLVPIPEDISDDVAAATLLKGCTAEYLLTRFRQVGPKQSILVHAASGGVGTLLIQWAKHLGATVIGTAGSTEKVNQALLNGADFAIDYSADDYVASVLEITEGKGVDIIYDGVGNATFERNFDCLAEMGTNALYGWASGKVQRIDVHDLNGKSHEMANPSLGHYTATREQLLHSANALFDVIRRGVVTPHIDKTYALTDAAQAHRDLEARRTRGSVLLVP